MEIEMKTKNKAYSLADWLKLEFVVDATFTGRYLLAISVLLAISLVFWVMSWFAPSPTVNFLADIPGVVGLLMFGMKAAKVRTSLTARMEDGKPVIRDSLGNEIK